MVGAVELGDPDVESLRALGARRSRETASAGDARGSGGPRARHPAGAIADRHGGAVGTGNGLGAVVVVDDVAAHARRARGDRGRGTVGADDRRRPAICGDHGARLAAAAGATGEADGQRRPRKPCHYLLPASHCHRHTPFDLATFTVGSNANWGIYCRCVEEMIMSHMTCDGVKGTECRCR